MMTPEEKTELESPASTGDGDQGSNAAFSRRPPGAPHKFFFGKGLAPQEAALLEQLPEVERRLEQAIATLEVEQAEVEAALHLLTTRLDCYRSLYQTVRAAPRAAPLRAEESSEEADLASEVDLRTSEESEDGPESDQVRDAGEVTPRSASAEENGVPTFELERESKDVEQKPRPEKLLPRGTTLRDHLKAFLKRQSRAISAPEARRWLRDRGVMCSPKRPYKLLNELWQNGELVKVVYGTGAGRGRRVFFALPGLVEVLGDGHVKFVKPSYGPHPSQLEGVKDPVPAVVDR